MCTLNTTLSSQTCRRAAVARTVAWFQMGREKYLVVDNCLRIVKDKLPVIAVDEAQEGHQGHGGFGLDRSELWQRDMAIPVNFR